MDSSGEVCFDRKRDLADCEADWQQRTVMLIGEDGARRLGEASVAVVGLGGVGGACAEALARAGIGSMILVDGDAVSLTNLNRQIIATRSTVGMPKTEAMARRVAEINPACRVTVKNEMIDGSSVGRLLALCPDFVADCIDSLGCKLDLIEACIMSNTSIISAMGAGNKLDPTRFRVTDISKTHTCPMARAVRQGLRQRGIDSGLKVVFSDEPPVRNGNRCPASISFVPPVAGYVMAGAIVQEIALCGKAGQEA